MDAATKRHARQLLGPDRELPDYPTVTQATKFVVTAPDAHNATAHADDLYDALDVAWQGYRMSEGPTFVWDLRGDGADHDATAEPCLIYVVGAFSVAE